MTTGKRALTGDRPVWQGSKADQENEMMRNLFVGICVSVAVAAFAWADTESNKGPIASTDEMQAWIEQLWEFGIKGRYGYRMPGTPASRQGAEYIRDKFQQFGLQDAAVESVDAPLSMPDKWSLTLRAEGRDEDMPCYFMRYAGFTPPEGITAPMVHLGFGSKEEFEAIDAAAGLEGKIVVVELIALPAGPVPTTLFTHDPDNTLAESSIMKGVSENWPIANLDVSYAMAKEYKAAGYVAILDFTVSDNNQYLHWYADGSLPALSISPNAGARLKKHLKSGPVEASMLLTGESITGPLSYVFASLPGRSEETIVVHTHHDGWAVNEASGVSVVLAIAQYFAQIPEVSRERTLQFVTFDSHFGKRGKQPEYWESVLPRAVAAISIEMIAKEYRIEDGKYVDTGLPSPTIFGVTPGKPELVSFVQEAIVRHDLRRSGIVPRFFGDGSAYNIEGIPLIERIAHNAPQFTKDDTPATVMTDALRPTAAAFIDIIERMDEMPAELLK